MNKKQAKARLEKLLDELDTLRMEAEETADGIEPYEGRYELTEQQEERQEWFSNLTSEIESAIDNIRSAMEE